MTGDRAAALSLADASASIPADAIEVARVLGAWGIKGGIKLKAFAVDPQALFSTKRWYLLPPELPRPAGMKPAGKWPTLLRVIDAREQGDTVVATVQDLEDRDAAEALKGARVFVSRGSFPTPGENEFYWIDLIGLSVVNRAGIALGRVVGLIETGPHCVLRILPATPGAAAPEADAAANEPSTPSSAESLIPFVAAYVDAVSLPDRLITVDWELDY